MSRRSQAQDADPVLITRTEDLAALCARLREEPFVTVDTEFMREKTYWPELCVVQLGGARDVAVIDAQAEGLDLAPLGELLADPKVTKVFHAARQDVEICILRFGAPPRPLFDTQIAAMVAGFGDQASYDSLVRGLANASIDKAHRFSDWSARPLSAAQIAYAAADVTHLRRVYTALVERLTEEGRLSWVAEEMAELTDPATYRQDPESAWERLKPRSGNRRFLAAVRAAAAWREREAQRVNIPRQRLVRDETLLEIAATSPASPAELSRARGISKGFADGKAGAGLLAALAAARDLPEAQLPEAQRDNRQGPPASPALIALLKVLLAAKAEEHHVAPRLIASSDELERLATEAEPQIPALHGWRRQIFGQAAVSLKSGRLALGVEGRKVKLIPS
ncbi:ribonuclease D [Roseomonas sp. KE0001]|uniref:ribonuclease D n=1 Tax=unclassified Roseomonas TaxID=2617492 RepID=UPI0018E01BD5|nr:ribonuclease D [Roseomonas sp. KE0001]MBI0434148.1 ribonuclease D [Roseomonas sp. KE0001]